jgi:hypothetical protein
MAVLTVDLDDAEHPALKILAVRRGTSMSRIVRDLIARPPCLVLLFAAHPT